MTGLFELEKAARKLADAVEFDMNGTTGKGGNGGLLSDTTLRAAHEVQALFNRPEKAPTDTLFTLEWWAAPRPLAHPARMKGTQSFVSMEMAMLFFRTLASDAEFISLTETQLIITDRSEEARRYFSALRVARQAEK